MSLSNNFPTLAPSFSIPFTNVRNIDSRVTVTRSLNTATYTDSTGVIRTALANTPRLDYDPSTLAPRGLLIEESRTNLLLQSADFATTWGATNVTVTTNSTASPDGGTNGDTITVNVAGNAVNQTTQTFVAGSTISITVFAKKNTSNFLRFEIGNLVNCWYDLNTGVVGTNSAGSGNILFSSKSIQAINNGWYRCVLVVTTTVITSAGVLIFPTNADNTSSSINSSIFVWGAQAEVGAFPTSYIPTTTTSLTRNADLVSVNNLTPWYNQTEGTLYVEFIGAYVASLKYPCIAAFRINAADTSANSFEIFAAGTSVSTSNGLVRVAGVDQISRNSPGIVFGSIIKSALGAKTNDMAFYTNGSINGTATTSGSLMTFDKMNIGTNSGINDFLNSYIRRITYYPFRITNAQLQTLTSS